MIIGDDLDSLLSALYLHRRYGWPVLGCYCRYSRLWHVGPRETFLRQFGRGQLVAVDLDIYHPAVPSIGHHILRLSDADGDLVGHTHSFNPNNLRGLSIQRGFRRKYPLATIHLLLCLFQEKKLAPEVELLVWLADSAFINAQQYQDNVTEWVNGYLQFPAFVEKLPALQTLAFEATLKEKILDRMAIHPLCRPLLKSGYRSRHLGLNGFQCQWDDPVRQQSEIQSLLQLLSDLTGWPMLPLSDWAATSFAGGQIVGRRNEMPVADLLATRLSFSEWLDRESVFSYAFTFRDRLNFTVIDF